MEELYKILEEPEKSNKKNISIFVQWFMFFLIILNIVAIVIGSFNNLNENAIILLHWFEIFSIIIFTIDYILRIITIRKKYTRKNIPYIFSFMGIIDLLSILPFYLSSIFVIDLRFLRIFRLLRIFKIFRHFNGLQTISNVIKNEKQKLLTAFSILLILLVFASSAMYYIENHYQPDKFSNILSTLWWAVATLTTIGYGDVFPITAIGKLLGGLIAILGIGLIALPSGIISAGLIKEATKTERIKLLEKYDAFIEILVDMNNKISHYLCDPQLKFKIMKKWWSNNGGTHKLNYSVWCSNENNSDFNLVFCVAINLTSDTPYLHLLLCKINPKYKIDWVKKNVGYNNKIEKLGNGKLINGLDRFYFIEDDLGIFYCCKIDIRSIPLNYDDDNYNIDEIKEVINILITLVNDNMHDIDMHKIVNLILLEEIFNEKIEEI